MIKDTIGHIRWGKKKQSGATKFIIKLGTIAVMLMVGITVGIVLADQSSSVKHLTSSLSGTQSNTSHYVYGVPNSNANQASNVAPSATPLVRTGKQPSTLQSELD